jgi:uncharacterized protein YbjT (DUF2867 family)
MVRAAAPKGERGMGDGVDLDSSPTDQSGPRIVTTGKVLVTGCSGFVGRYVVRELIARGYRPVCLVRDLERLKNLLLPEQSTRVSIVRGGLSDSSALEEAAKGCAAVIHLVGIIMEQRLRGQTFERVHVEGTRNVVAACVRAGIRRYVHMSALGTRPAAPTAYFRTKWAAEEIVRKAGLDWTIFRPSIIHGPDGEFMQMMKFFSTSRVRSPFMPYFGSGEALVQPVSVRDVAACFVKCLSRPATIGKAYELGGPERLTWKELYDACALAITGKRRIKLSVPVFAAELAARVVMPLTPSFLVPYKFNAGQVRMSQEDGTCDTRPVEEALGIHLRDFRQELALYADQI